MRKHVKLLSLFALPALFVACGGGESGAPAAEEAAPAAEAQAPAEAPAVDMELPEGVTAEMVAQGETIFGGTGICYTCHLPGGVGGPLAPNLTDGEWINTDGSYQGIVQTITTGVSQPQQHPGIMLPKGGSSITDEEVRAVAAYVWSLSQGG